MTSDDHSRMNPGRRWWREPEILFIFLFVAGAYFLRLGDLSLRGEEPTRAQIAFEMIDGGDWVVPREQGEPFLSRPPLQNWLIAIASLLFGSRDAWVLRLPSALATLATAWLIYGYARTRLCRTGGLTAALAFLTFGEILTQGGQAETESVFILLVAASLILWHWGESCGWVALATWLAGYVCVALAILCKGPQPPVYFAAAVGGYCLLTGQWRRLLSWQHFAGIGACLAIVLGWVVPCAALTSWTQVWGIVFNDSHSRFHDWQAAAVATHLVVFPLEVLGCTLPWSLLLLAYASRTVRRSLGPAAPMALFMTLSAGFAFITCWLPPEARTRYFTPLHPCLAVLVGCVVELCLRADVPEILRQAWRRYAALLGSVIVAAAVVVLAVSVLLPAEPRYAAWAEPLPTALLFAGCAAVLATLVFRSLNLGDERRVRHAAVAVAIFMALLWNTVITGVRIRRSEDHATSVAEVKGLLPHGQRLYSLGHVDSLFAFYLGAPITPLPALVNPDVIPADLEYFCFLSEYGQRPKLPFPWQEAAAISLDRNRHAVPERVVVIGRVARPGQAPINPASSANSKSQWAKRRRTSP